MSMTEAELKSFTLASAARAVRQRKVSPVELTTAVLERAHTLNDRMRALITITSDHALAQARDAERQLSTGATIGPLHGVPISLKDLFDTKGIATTAGSKVFADRIPHDDAHVVKKLAGAGSVLIGKANLHEFAFGVTTINPHFGTARNP